MDSSTDTTKADAANEVLKLFSFFSSNFAFMDTEVANFSEEGKVSEEGLVLNAIYSLLDLFFE